MKMSSGLCMGMLGGSGGDKFQALMALGFVRVFAGSAPASADAAETGTLLCIVSVNDTGTGVTFDDPVIVSSVAVISKAAAEIWSGTNVAGGVATYYRLVGAADDGTLSTSQPRTQGTVGLGGTDMVLGNTTLTNASLFTLPYFTEALVPS